MSDTSTQDHFASVDRLISTARATWEAEKAQFEEHIKKLELELELNQTARDKAEKACAAAERVTTKLLTQFGIVSLVFGEAKQMALEAGFLTPEKIQEVTKAQATPVPTNELVPRADG